MSDRKTSGGFMARLGAPQTPPPWTLTEVGVLLVVLALATMILSSGIAVAVVGDPQLLSPMALVIGWIVGLGVVTAYVWVSRRRTAQDRDAMQLKGGLLPLPLVLLIGVAIGFTLDLIAGFAGSNFGRVAELRGLTTSDVAHVIAGAILVIVVAPLAHTLVFAGVILPRLRASLGVWAGLLTTVVLFTVYYVVIYGAQLPASERVWYGVVLPFATMLAICALKLRTHSTLAAIVASVGVGITAWMVMLVLG
jgi:membrane protease YdiL (CAAX protease family)